jgi:peptide/nickel transport system permease protein/oligopeptide transport system permease protein
MGFKGDDSMKYIMKRIYTLVITLFMVSFLTFIAFQVIPGDSAVTSLGTNATEEAIDALREELGLNENVLVRFFTWIGNTLQGDFGKSFQYELPVKSLVGDRMPVTLWLSLLSIIIILIVSIPLGILTAKKEGGFIDRLITLITNTSMAIPPFFLGMIITLVFGFVLKWFIPGRYVNPSDNFGQFIRFMIFPALAIGIPKIAMVVKFLRSSVLRQLKQDYVRTARSKGQKENTILYRHVLKNALIPVITFIAMVIADIMAGSIIIEQVFGLPGLGRLLVTSISNRDYPVVQIIILYIAAVVVIVNFIVDILYQYIDPRVRV